ncbi:MAG: WcbI family polysaccharide biosynthesis putative acetyltransferase, partial [Paracoccaceae bacterium]
DSFVVPYLASNTLRKVYGDKVLVWPNMFFSGQQPYLRYVTHKTAGRLPGPIDTLHDLRILRDWLRNRGVDQLQQLDAPDYAEKVTKASLAEIETRELGCDLRISDVIVSEFRERRLFFTFNHPSNWLLQRLAERILDRIGRPMKIDDTAPREYLARYVTPSIWMDLDTQGATFTGTGMDLRAAGKAPPTDLRSFSSAELREAFNACYDHLLKMPDLSDFRFTPAY